MQRRRMWSRTLYPVTAGALLVIGLAGLLLNNHSVATGAAQETLVAIAVPAQARTGESIAVEIVATNARDLAGFQAAINYDEAQLRMTGMASGIGLGVSGRDVLALPPVARPGAVVLGAATCPVSNCNQRQLARPPRITTGVDGRVVLGSVSFYTEAAGQYQLSLDNVQLVDPQGNQLTAVTANATLIVTE